MRDFYILDSNGEPVREPDLMKWACAFEKSARSVAREIIMSDEGTEIVVSTAFLGIDHNHSGKGPPILWETMVFGGPLDQAQVRCSGSREQAEAMHARMIQCVRREIAQPK